MADDGVTHVRVWTVVWSDPCLGLSPSHGTSGYVGFGRTRLTTGESVSPESRSLGLTGYWGPVKAERGPVFLRFGCLTRKDHDPQTSLGLFRS